MKKRSDKAIVLDDHLGCFGDFNLNDRLCRRFCSLSLQCAIERDQNEQMELLEDLVSSDSMYIKMH